MVLSPIVFLNIFERCRNHLPGYGSTGCDTGLPGRLAFQTRTLLPFCFPLGSLLQVPLPTPKPISREEETKKTLFMIFSADKWQMLTGA